ncbi:DUF3811 domain-containing protein [Edaphovirga cremea]|jgi:molecular chaperone DnaK (HSP70)|uniref:DUF3811 domain-containing protein n=1 Tax=Edaphovirga cremea TaxID=2267246 RepID=UPI000DEFD6C8|nr:DUF3811 domain-containing protein [Edaphovirga cremea]
MNTLTQKDLTESEQRQLNALLAQARKAHERELTNAERNKIKDDFFAEIGEQREKTATKNRAERKRLKASAPSTSATFDWTARTHPRGRR